MGSLDTIFRKTGTESVDSQAEFADSRKFAKAIFDSSQGNRFLATRDPATGRFTTTSIKCPERVMQLALKEAQEGHDAYFTPAGFKSSDSRKAENALEAGSMWMDIDVGPQKAKKGTGYETLEDGKAALMGFCEEAQLPRPTAVIHSGTGIQSYWILDEPMPKQEWQECAGKLKKITKHHGFLADPTRTADIASLMRLPGTSNYKYSPEKPVELKCMEKVPICRTAMTAAIEAEFARISTQEPMAVRANATECDPHQLDILKAALRCLDPDMPYFDWFRVAAAIYNETGGHEAGYALFDSWSIRGDKYKSPKDTRKLWKSLRPDCPKPITIGSLCWMVREAGYDWQKDVISVAEWEVRS